MTRLTTVLMIWSLCGAVIAADEGPSVSFSAGDVGVIADASSTSYGSGFVIGASKAIVTCYHVIMDIEGPTYEPAGTQTPYLDNCYSLEIDYILPEYDLAVLRSTKGIKCMSLSFGDIHRIRPGDSVIYAGLDSNRQGFAVHMGTVTATGNALSDIVSENTSDGKTVVSFLEFEGEGIPGYSGGPVFDREGNVIAIMREAWHKKGVKGGEPRLINRAWSIEPLSILEEKVQQSGACRR